MTIYSKIVTFGSPNWAAVTTHHPTVTKTETGRRKQQAAAAEMVGTGSCTDARVIAGPDRNSVAAASIADYVELGCRQNED